MPADSDVVFDIEIKELVPIKPPAEYKFDPRNRVYGPTIPEPTDEKAVSVFLEYKQYLLVEKEDGEIE